MHILDSGFQSPFGTNSVDPAQQRDEDAADRREEDAAEWGQSSLWEIAEDEKGVEIAEDEKGEEIAEDEEGEEIEPESHNSEGKTLRRPERVALRYSRRAILRTVRSD